jgi:hypothetical protein
MISVIFIRSSRPELLTGRHMKAGLPRASLRADDADWAWPCGGKGSRNSPSPSFFTSIYRESLVHPMCKG